MRLVMLADLGRDLRYAVRTLLRAPDVCGDGHCDARPRHWRQLGDLQRGRRRPLARRARGGSGQPRRRLHDIRQQPLLELVLSGLFRLAGQRHVRVAGGLYAGVDHDGCERSAGAARRAARERQLLRGAWGQHPTRPRVYARRRSTRGAGSRGGHLACALAARVQRRSVADRPDDSPQQQPVHGDRCRATGVRRSAFSASRQTSGCRRRFSPKWIRRQRQSGARAVIRRSSTCAVRED